MRNAIILLILAVVFFAAGWTIYRFVAKRAQEVQVALDGAPSLQQAPTATPTAVVVKLTPTPAPTPSLTSNPTATPKSPVVSTEKLPTTGPASEALLLMGGLVTAVGVGIRQRNLTAQLKNAYKK